MLRYQSNVCFSSQKCGPLLWLGATCGCLLRRLNRSVVPHLDTPMMWKYGMQNRPVAFCLREVQVVDTLNETSRLIACSKDAPARVFEPLVEAAGGHRVKHVAAGGDDVFSAHALHPGGPIFLGAEDRRGGGCRTQRWGGSLVLLDHLRAVFRQDGSLLIRQLGQRRQLWHRRVRVLGHEGGQVQRRVHVIGGEQLAAVGRAGIRRA